MKQPLNKKPKKTEEPEGDPERGDEILKRMLQSKPKPHKDLVKGRRAKPSPKPSRKDR